MLLKIFRKQSSQPAQSRPPGKASGEKTAQGSQSVSSSFLFAFINDSISRRLTVQGCIVRKALIEIVHSERQCTPKDSAPRRTQPYFQRRFSSAKKVAAVVPVRTTRDKERSTQTIFVFKTDVIALVAQRAKADDSRTG